MDRAAYQQWWQLHLRVARGETLSPEETSAYHAALGKLEGDDRLREAASAREAREALTALVAGHERWEARRRQLDDEIAALESRLSDATREFLGAGG